MRQTPKGLYVWDQTTDSFNHNQLAANWDLVDTLLGQAGQQLENGPTVPTTDLFNGRMFFLTAADDGFQPMTLLVYSTSWTNGPATGWRNIGYEVHPSLPTDGNYPGRLIMLSAIVNSGGYNFGAWEMVRFDGTNWASVAGFSAINNGAGATNIKGLQTAGDVFINVGARGFVLTDRTTGLKWRLYFNNGALHQEQVT